MARIRTIKPEFWESTTIGRVSVPSRLLFICLWNYADDGGNYPAFIQAMKRHCFGFDDVSADDVQGWMDELIRNKLVVIYEADGDSYWHISGFHEHQRIDKPTYKYPPFQDHSTTSRQPIDDHSTTSRQPIDDSRVVVKESSVKERKGEECVVTDVVIPTESDTVSARSGLLARAFHNHGIQVNPGDPRLRKWAENGLPPETVTAAVEKARKRKPGGRFRFEYFIPVIEELQQQAESLKAGKDAKPPNSALSIDEQWAEVDRQRAEESLVIDGNVREVGSGYIGN